MGRIAGKKHAPVTHGFCNKAAHSGDALLRNRSHVGLPSIITLQASVKFIPDSIVGPLRNVFIRRALQIQSRDSVGAHAEQRETPLVQAVDEFRRRRGGVGQNAEPAEGIDALVDLDVTRGNRARQMP